MTRQLSSPVVPSTRRKMPYEKFIETDWDNAHVEWVKGEVIEMPPIDLGHADLNDFLRALVRIFVETRKLGRVLSDPFNMHLQAADAGRSPDLLFVSNAHARRIRQTHLEGPADLAVEIVSRGSRGTDRGDKFYEYEQGGVREYWLIDAARRQADFFALRKSGTSRLYRPIRVGEDGIFRSGVLKPFWIKVDWLWQRPLRPVMDALNEVTADLPVKP